ncbi:pentapeptide repeat-containing protein [Amycolatopsis sp. 195334CR]|uniref:pentapeptide repeat-containing protein n=1 Tax=Amycolatopsis sp. 195334CR TaxID=2814588 RepID=UPI001A8E85CC|nr:pentapeptide repeat-containing protein [Amycolatopsis sp. 195334CR]MBN6035102.1 pentapeptide repeat-containing protein [Amycolatopsis sp. 195334CR]
MNDRKSRAPLPVWLVPLATVLVLAVAAVVLLWLWRWIDGLAMANSKDRATAQLDAVKIAASIVVAGGGVFALYLAARRQRTQEEELRVRHTELAQRDRTQLHAEQDARARQVTEQYTKAVEQLGHERAAVRLGGLYALERLAQEHHDQRRPVVSVLCAYLRMPYLDPEEAGADLDTRLREREVRLTIQRLLREHAHNVPELGSDPDPAYWGNDIDVDLTGATLINFDLAERRVHPSTKFTRAKFLGDAHFRETTFTSDADIDEAEFTHLAFFQEAKFLRLADFYRTKFRGDTSFGGTRFNESSYFVEATFEGTASFSKAEFVFLADFHDAVFEDGAWFDYAAFVNGAGFSNTAFAQHPDFNDAKVKAADDALHIWPKGWAPGAPAPDEERDGEWATLAAAGG